MKGVPLPGVQRSLRSPCTVASSRTHPSDQMIESSATAASPKKARIDHFDFAHSFRRRDYGPSSRSKAASHARHETHLPADGHVQPAIRLALPAEQEVVVTVADDAVDGGALESGHSGPGLSTAGGTTARTRTRRRSGPPQRARIANSVEEGCCGWESFRAFSRSGCHAVRSLASRNAGSEWRRRVGRNDAGSDLPRPLIRLRHLLPPKGRRV